MKQKKITPIKTIAISIFALLIVAPHIVSAESYQGVHQGVRPLGMGGAFTAVADDHNAIFYNTAGLAQTNSFSMGILDPYVSVSKNSIDLINDFGDANTDDTNEVNEVLRKYLGENNSIKVATDIYTRFKVKDYGVMVTAIGQSDNDISIHNPVWPEVRIKSKVDIGAIIGAGAAVPMVKGLKVGAALKIINRQSLDKVYTAIDIANSDDFADTIDDDMEKGSGAAIDIGVLYSVEGVPFTKVDLAFTGQNIPSMNFGDAVDSKTQYNAGVALKQKVGILRLTEAIDYIDITDNLSNDNSIEKKLHFGVEASIPVLSVRAGMNQGYYTAGATVKLWVVRFDVATFGEEVGAYAGQKEDRQLAAQLSIGWDW